MTDLFTAPDIASVGGLNASSVFPVTKAPGDTLYRATGAEIAAAYGGSGGGGGGGGGVIASHVFSAGETSITIAIPSTFKDLEFTFAGNGTGNAQTRLYYNGDATDGNYYHVRSDKGGMVAASFPYFVELNGDADKDQVSTWSQPGYNDALKHTRTGLSSLWAGSFYSWILSNMTWTGGPAAPITSVTFSIDAGSFKPGSRFTVYGKGESGGGSGLIGHVVTAGSQASVDFASLPGTFANLTLRARAATQDTNTGNTQNTIVRFNGDTTSGNYGTTGQGLYGGGPVGFPSAGGLLVPAFGAGAHWGQFTMDINGYALADTKTWTGRSASIQVNVGICSSTGAGIWVGTGPITEITLTPTGGFAWQDGSEFWLYGS